MSWHKVALNVNKNVMEILACPVCKGELLFDKGKEELFCRVDKLAFPVVDGIPVMLVERARKVEE